MHGAMVCLAIHQTSLSVDGRSGFFSKNFAAKYFSGSLSSSRSTFCKCANFSFKCFWEGVNNKSLGKLKKYSEKFQSGPDRCATQKSRNGDTLGPVELNVGLEQGNQGARREQDD